MLALRYHRTVTASLLRQIAPALIVVAMGCSPTPADDEAVFLREIDSFRRAKDEAFRQDGSPIPADKLATLVPLAYFPPSAIYRVPAVLSVTKEQATMEMPTSTGLMRAMRHVGTLEFSVKGQPLSLGAFVEAGAADYNRLFVPFTDLTSGTETYPAGRYLDLDLTRTGIYVIDFNRAYNPYCYYNPTYDCPYPPRSNRLEVPIRAGEKVRDGVVPVLPSR